MNAVPFDTFLALFPFNWFPLREGSSEKTIYIDFEVEGIVSIQLVSPARGEPQSSAPSTPGSGFRMFPFNWFPLREGSDGLT